MMNTLSVHSNELFPKILQAIDMQIHNFDLERCDERTFYLTILLNYEKHQVICDLIYLIDKEELYGAISLNHLYEQAQQFFSRHFNYALLYKDEIRIAQSFSQTQEFLTCLKTYAKKYPKYVQPKFFK